MLFENREPKTENVRTKNCLRTDFYGCVIFSGFTS